MPDFNKIHAQVMKTEGGYANNPADAGGETYKGIARKHHPKWQGWKYIDGVKALTNPMPHYGTEAYRHWVSYINDKLGRFNQLQRAVTDFYFVNFWNANCLGLIGDEAVAAWIYDHIVNASGRGVIWAQLAARVTPDGKIGPVTLTAINSADPAEFLSRAADIAGAYRLDRANDRPSQIQFLTSWLRRDGQPPEIIAMVRQAARDGRLDDREVAGLKTAMEATA